jgi:hypothetical protein
MKNDILQKLNWKDVCQSVEQVNPTLAKIINNIDPSNHHKLIKATYSFGDLIVKEGRLCLPIENDELYAELNYSAIPLSLLLNKSAEVFIENSDSSLPLNILSPGDFFGTFEVVNFMMNKKSCPSWNVSAGVRSTFMLPKISSSSGIKRLRSHYNIAPHTQLGRLDDHWNLFKQIALKPNFTELWKSEVLFFPKQWFANIKDVVWFEFYQFIWKQAWSQAQYAMSDFNLRLHWEACIKIIDARRLKPSLYIMDTIKHLLTIMMGLAPFFTPAEDLELDLPLTELQRAFTDIYLLERYIPTIMLPDIFSSRRHSSTGYYSLALPNLMSGMHPVKLLTSFMPDLKMIKLIMTHLSADIKESKDLHNIFLEYFHAAKDKFQDVQLSTEIPITDLAFEREQKKFPGRTFCATSAFWQGCIRIHSEA